MTLVMVASVGMPPSTRCSLAENWITRASQGHAVERLTDISANNMTQHHILVDERKLRHLRIHKPRAACLCLRAGGPLQRRERVAGASRGAVLPQRRQLAVGIPLRSL
ncbi:hypothetical protein PAM7971_03811 [Pacificibacter marinus]|uniref:Uncharacterized protein n=1 Tax=Pacificibacter marinus TaxID=658057 RepID=A0A1Y5TSA9_9RHOB|nr:hypothetical protein PAM7971_03811 [Pacificibacter marinus]